MSGKQEQVRVSFEQKKLCIEIEAELPPKLAAAIEEERQYEQKQGRRLTFDEMAITLLQEGIKAAETRLAAAKEQEPD